MKLNDYLKGEDYGVVKYEGKNLVLMQQAYLEYDGNYGAHYRALAEDEEGKEYVVYWGITDGEAEDESDACDWAVYRVRAL